MHVKHQLFDFITYQKKRSSFCIETWIHGATPQPQLISTLSIHCYSADPFLPRDYILSQYDFPSTPLSNWFHGIKKMIWEIGLDIRLRSRVPSIFSVPESRLVILQVLRYKTSLVMRLMTKLHHRLTRIWLGQISLQKIKGRETNYDRRNWINGCSFIFLLYFALKVMLNQSGREKSS